MDDGGFGPNVSRSDQREQQSSASPEPVLSTSQPRPFGTDKSGTIVSTSTVNAAFHTYFEHCHRQPVWLFDLNSDGDYSNVTDDVSLAVVALATHFERGNTLFGQYLGDARRLIMSQIANGTVRLSTIEAVCLLSLSCFLANDLSLGRFHVALGLQLCRAAYIDTVIGYQTEYQAENRKRRVFWSLQILEFYHGDSPTTVNISSLLGQGCNNTDCDSSYSFNRSLPSIPEEDNQSLDSTDCGIWGFLLQMGHVWKQARAFLSVCVTGRIQEPWRPDSMYARIVADVLAVESRMPMCHRWQTIRIQEQDHDTVRLNSHYLKPWIALQVTYRTIHTLANHPFLYMAAAQHNKKLAVLNTFWTHSSQLALLQATWIVRCVDIAFDRQLQMSDIIFAQAVAIAATVHLYYLSASDPRLRKKSATDLAKCMAFFRSSRACSTLCTTLNHRLEKLLAAALGVNWSDFEFQNRIQISLSAGLMYDVLELSCSDDTIAGVRTCNSLLHWSLASAIPSEDQSPGNLVFEVGPAFSDARSDIDCIDGGQSAPTRLSMVSPAATRSQSSPKPALSSRNDPANSNTVLGGDTPNNPAWVWSSNDNGSSSSHVHTFDLEVAALGDADNAFWWNFENM